MSHLSRRQTLLGLSTVAGVSLMPGVAFARAETEKRLVVIVLRGAMDGMHALPPIGDPDYARIRPTLSLGGERPALDLTTDFGLHPALEPLLPLYRAGELSFVPAVGTRYDRRSHFEAQDVLEGGGLRPYAKSTGWLNRALAIQNLGRDATQARIGLAVGATVPLLLRGDADVRTLSASRLPDATEDFLFRADGLMQSDPLFHAAFAQAQMDRSEQMDLGLPGGARLSADDTASSVATLLGSADGPRIAVLESGGWDTHFGQLRRLNTQFAELATVITGLKSGLGPVWADTSVLVVSEFGRTAAENGSGGTDHGTGGLAIVAGGGLGKKRILGDWPGLSPAALHEGRDVRATTALESVFMAALTDHLGLDPARVRRDVFPDHGGLGRLPGLYRT